MLNSKKCEICGVIFERQVPRKTKPKKAKLGSWTIEYVNCCSPKCRSKANLKRGRKSPNEESQERFEKFINDKLNLIHEKMFFGSIAQW